MSEKAPLQDQLSKGMRAGRPGVQQQRCRGVAKMCEQPAILKVEIDIGRIAITSCPTLGDRWNNGTQNFAALHLRRSFLLFCRFGMKWAGGLRRILFCCHRRERAMIRDCDPGTDRNRNARVSRNRTHRELQSLTQGESQTFSLESRIGAIAADGILSGGTTSGTGAVEICGI